MSPRRRPSLALGVLWVAAAIADDLSAFQQAGAPSALEAGWAAYQGGDLETADASFRAATAAGEAEGWLGRAEVARRRERPGEALIAFREYLSRAPEDERNRLEFARLLSWEGKYAESEGEFRRLAAEADSAELRAAARRGLADALAWSGRHREAHALYLEALADFPSDPALNAALGELESWRGRDGAAAQRLAYSLAAQQEPRVQALADSAAQRLRPEAFVQVQAFADDSDWRRNKVLLGASGRLLPERHPDARTTIAVEYATFEEASGRDLARRSLVVRHRDRITPFATLDLDAAYGEGRDDASWRGGVRADFQPADRAWIWAGIRRDDHADPVPVADFDRYNGAFTVDLLRGRILQATTLRGGVRAQNAQGAGFLAELAGGPIEDGNGRAEAYAQVHRDREYAPGRRSIPRFFYHHLGFADPSALYFSPENLDAWGVGWRWEAAEGSWTAFADGALFWQAGSVDDYGLQLAAGWEREFDAGFRLRVEANFLSTDDRSAADRYEAYALAAAVVVPF